MALWTPLGAGRRPPNLKKIRLRRIFALCSPKKNDKDFKNFPSPADFSFVFPYEKSSTFQEKTASGEFLLCISLRKMIKFKDTPPPADFSFVFLKEIDPESRIPRLRRIFLCVFLRGIIRNSKNRLRRISPLHFVIPWGNHQNRKS